MDRADAQPAWRFAALAAALGALVHLGALGQEMVYDDLPLVAWNQRLESLSQLGECLTTPYWGAGATTTGLYRPLTIASFNLNRALLGAAPWGFKLVNLLLHAGVCALVVRLAVALGARRAAAAAAGVLFAVHPVHTEAVVWISGRAELLCAFFSLAALVVYLEGRDGSSGRRLCLGLLFAAALGAKEHALAFGAAFPLIDMLASGTGLERLRRRWPDVLVLVLVAALLLMARWAVLGEGWRPRYVVPLDNPLVPAVRSVLGNAYGMGPLEARSAALGILPEHLRLLAFPRVLSADYSYAQLPLARSLLSPRALLGLGLVVGSGAGVLALRRRAPVAACGLLVLAAASVTTCNLIVRIGTPLAERLLYLPSVGFVLFVAAAWGVAWSRPGRRPFLVAVLAAVTLALAGRTLAQVPVWSDRLTLWEATVRSAPDSAKAHQKLGAVLHDMAAGEPRLARLYPAAARHLQRALEIYPERAETNERLAVCLTELGRPEEALAHFRTASVLQQGRVSERLRQAWSRALTAVLADLPDGEGERRRALEAELERVTRG